ncbi:MAG TPA: transposase [Bacteroidota bacterium]|nr:transposase [Bacteroidota bacterium]
MTGTDRGFFYQRHLPHYQPPDSTFSVMFRLAGTLPFEAIQRLSEERLRYHQLMRTNTSSTEGTKSKRLLKQEQYFRRFDELLDGYSFGPTWLKQEKIAELLSEAIHYRDQKVYDLLAYCIMANHVHMVFSIEGFGIKSGFEKTSKTGRDSVPSNTVTDILGSLKKFTGLRANKLLRREGAFWQDESCDHVVRENELENAIWYVLNNPVKAGLVKDWRDWRWTYLKEGVI